MTSRTLRGVATVLALPAAVLGPLAPVVILLGSAWQPEAAALPPSPSCPAVAWAVGAVPLSVLLVWGVHRAPHHAKGLAVGAGVLAAAASLTMLWVGLETQAAFAVFGVSSMEPWVFGPAVAMHGVPAVQAGLAAAVSRRHRIGTTVAALALLVVTSGGLLASARLHELTGGPLWTWSPRGAALLAHGATMPPLALGMLLFAWRHPGWQDVAHEVR